MQQRELKKSKKAKRGKGAAPSNPDDTLLKTDVVKFGEVVHAPPTLETEKLDKKLTDNQKVIEKVLSIYVLY